MRHPMGWVKLGLWLGMVGAAWAVAGSAVVEQYDVNAQYRGGVKKGFPELGQCKGSYLEVGPGAFQVKIKGQVRHPEENKMYEFDVRQTFSLEGDQIRMTSQEKLELNEHAKPNEDRITEVVPFAYMVRHLPLPKQGAGAPERAFHYGGQLYTLRYAQVEGRSEVSLFRGEDLRGKFFLVPGRDAQFSDLVKFRVLLPGEQLVVSFVNKTPPPDSTAQRPGQ